MVATRQLMTTRGEWAQQARAVAQDAWCGAREARAPGQGDSQAIKGRSRGQTPWSSFPTSLIRWSPGSTTERGSGTAITRKGPDRLLAGSRYLDRRRYPLHPRRQSLCWSAGAVSPLQRADPAVSWASVASGPCRWTGKHRRWRQWRSGPFREIAVKDPRSVVQQFQGVW